MSYIEELERIIPGNLLAARCNLLPLGVDDMAWQYQDVKAVLDVLRAHGKMILGGEVFSFRSGEIDSTWDAWDYKKNTSLPPAENVERSYRVALNYIESYKRDEGDDFCYSVVI